jgi:hypothetical protein
LVPRRSATRLPMLQDIRAFSSQSNGELCGFFLHASGA